MTNNEIIEGNRTIALFIGGTSLVNSHFEFFDKSIYPDFKLQYHTSWDWLKPVIDKILEEGKKHSIFHPINITRVEIFKTVSIFSPISNAHHAVVEFIKWYNANQKGE